MNETSVLFICQHNSARSRMAEAFLNQLGGPAFSVESAGFETAPVNPLAAEAMREIGLDIAEKPSQKVFDLFKAGRRYEYVITVCDESQALQCPVFPGIVKRCHWSFPDPSGFTGTRDEQLEKVRAVRDGIREAVAAWVKARCKCAIVSEKDAEAL